MRGKKKKVAAGTQKAPFTLGVSGKRREEGVLVGEVRVPGWVRAGRGLSEG